MGLKDTVAINIAKRRRKLKMSQTELAERINKSLSSVAKLENYHTGITVDTLENYAKALKCDVCDLVKGDNNGN